MIKNILRDQFLDRDVRSEERAGEEGGGGCRGRIRSQQPTQRHSI